MIDQAADRWAFLAKTLKMNVRLDAVKPSEGARQE